MPESPLSSAVWDALRQLSYEDGERVAVVSSLNHLRERAARDAQLEEAKARLDAAHGAVATAGAERRAHEADSQDLTLRVKRTEARLASGALQSEREIAAAQTEIIRLREAISAAETGWLEASTREDAAKQALPEVAAAFELEDRAAALRLAAMQREIAAAEERLASIDRVRRDAAKLLPKEIFDRYRALYARTGGRPFALASAGECSHCHRAVPAEAMQALRARTGVPACPSCGRLLLTP
jgi:predicted  nucleic acid-binding Zn-ribbon protein